MVRVEGGKERSAHNTYQEQRSWRSRRYLGRTWQGSPGYQGLQASCQAGPTAWPSRHQR